jgi:hypothetical protein
LLKRVEVAVLTSLLPGFRELRVPLTIGYFWLFDAWIWFSGALPDKRPEDGPVARAFDLSDLLGTAAVLAAVSFLAYLIGSLLQIPLLIRLPEWFIRLFPVESSDSKATREEYQSFLGRLGDRIETRISGFQPHDYEEVTSDAHRATAATVDELRPRLLVANQELYSEYDRLASEAQFRINVCPPLLALGVTASLSEACWWILPAAVVTYALLSQGLRKRAQSVSVIQRAVLGGVLDHPLQTILDRFGPAK